MDAADRSCTMKRGNPRLQQQNHTRRDWEGLSIKLSAMVKNKRQLVRIPGVSITGFETVIYNR
jgi:hypothetical protein